MKSGLTANIDIQTKHKDNVLDSSAICDFTKLTEEHLWKLSVINIDANSRDARYTRSKRKCGNVSGVTAGEQVINIGLK